MFILRILLRLAATVGVTWLMATYLPQYVVVGGGLRGIIFAGIILAVLNLCLRVVLDVILFPLRFVSKLVVLILVNAALLWFAGKVANLFSEHIVRFSIEGGWIGWIVASAVFGFLSWLVRTLLQEGDKRGDNSTLPPSGPGVEGGA